MLVYAQGWSLASQFWSDTPPPKVSFPAAKKWKFPTENCCFWSKIFLDFFCVFCVCSANFVTPFSTLTKIKGSLPTNSTTLDRLRWWARPSGDVSRFFEEEKHKKSFFSCPPSSPDLHAKRSLKPDFCDRGVSNRVTNAGQQIFSSWRGELVLGKCFITHIHIVTYKLAAPRKAAFYLVTFFSI